MTFDDTTAAAGQNYIYRVTATNTVGDIWDYTATNPLAAGFSHVAVKSSSIQMSVAT